MLTTLNPLVRYAGAVKVGLANTGCCVGRENRIFYFTSGEAVLVIAGKPYRVSKDTLVYIPSYTEYRFELRTSCDDVTLVCLNFDVTARDDRGESHTRPIEVSEWDGARDGAEELPSEFSQPIVIDDAESVYKDFTKLTKIYFNREPYFADYASMYMKKILLFTLTRSVTDRSSEPAARILEYVKKNCRERITNTELAKRFNYHPNHLNRVVKSYTGSTLKAYMIACRLSFARELLATTDDPITEISENCGFSTPSYFAELFSRSEGITPREYRNRVRNIVI